jgi:hypothetical protein
MLDVYYPERWYNMDWLVVIVVCWNFTIEKETHNTLNYLYLTIANNHNKLTFGKYRKPTNTDLILHNDSCHPNKHKNSAITCLVNRMTTYPITQENKVLELNAINEILASNHHRQRINSTALNQHSSPKNPRNAKIKKGHVYILWPWNENNYKIIKNNNVGIAFKTNNTTKNHLKLKNQITDIYQKMWGIPTKT